MRRIILIEEKTCRYQVLDNIANFHFPGVNELLMSTLALFQLGNKMGDMAPRQYDDIWLYI